jgi:hypothetical protein
MKRTKSQRDEKDKRIEQLEAQLKQASEEAQRKWTEYVAQSKVTSDRREILEAALKTASDAAIAQDDRHRKTNEENRQIAARIDANHQRDVRALRQTIEKLLDQLAPSSVVTLDNVLRPKSTQWHVVDARPLTGLYTLDVTIPDHYRNTLWDTLKSRVNTLSPAEQEEILSAAIETANAHRAPNKG